MDAIKVRLVIRIQANRQIDHQGSLLQVQVIEMGGRRLIPKRKIDRGQSFVLLLKQ